MDELDLGITCGLEFHARQSFAACRSCILWIYQPLRPCLLLKSVIAKIAFEILLWYSSCEDLATFWSTRRPGGKAIILCLRKRGLSHVAAQMGLVHLRAFGTSRSLIPPRFSVSTLYPSKTRRWVNYLYQNGELCGELSPRCESDVRSLRWRELTDGKGELENFVAAFDAVGPRCRYKGVEVLHETG
jgi:hypothetical protein